MIASLPLPHYAFSLTLRRRLFYDANLHLHSKEEEEEEKWQEQTASNEIAEELKTMWASMARP